jgi:hypothetical protein
MTDECLSCGAPTIRAEYYAECREQDSGPA